MVPPSPCHLRGDTAGFGGDRQPCSEHRSRAAASVMSLAGDGLTISLALIQTRLGNYLRLKQHNTLLHTLCLLVSPSPAQPDLTGSWVSTGRAGLLWRHRSSCKFKTTRHRFHPVWHCCHPAWHRCHPRAASSKSPHSPGQCWSRAEAVCSTVG